MTQILIIHLTFSKKKQSSHTTNIIFPFCGVFNEQHISVLQFSRPEHWNAFHFHVLHTINQRFPWRSTRFLWSAIEDESISEREQSEHFGAALLKNIWHRKKVKLLNESLIFCKEGNLVIFFFSGRAKSARARVWERGNSEPDEMKWLERGQRSLIEQREVPP